MSITNPNETWDEFEARLERNKLKSRIAETGLQLVVNKPSRTDTTKKRNARVMKKWKMGAL